MSYEKHAVYNLFYRPGSEAFGYSEGQEAEQRLLDIVESVSDRSTLSTEWLDKIVDWSTRYHFSRARHCLLRPLDIQPGERVLELGCGTGAITRYLGETGAEVTAVEGSLARAKVAAARCVDLPNVTVIADDLQSADVEGQYDWVTLIGVLEYAAAYSSAEDPYQAYLASAIRHLKPGGRVVVAIENQLGLKYFNGCAEDHLGTLFSGIQGLYQPEGGVRTFGRKALSGVLSEAGLGRQQWLYPFPDYKVPSVVLSDIGLARPDFNGVDLLLRSFSEDYSGNDLRLFDEALVNRVLARNDLLADLSNSFLVVASRPVQAAQSDDASWAPTALAWSYSVHRQAGLCTETRFLQNGSAGIRAQKCRLQPEAPRCVPWMRQQTLLLTVQEESAYFLGEQAAWHFLYRHASGGDTASLVEALLPWCQSLLSDARAEVSPVCEADVPAGDATATGATRPDERDTDDTIPVPGSSEAQQGADERVYRGGLALLRERALPGHSIDLVPFNIMQDRDGRQQIIDQEWVASCVIPAGWVLTRGVWHLLRMGVVTGNELKSLGSIVMMLAERCGYYATRDDIDGWMQMEEQFQSAVAAQPLHDLRQALMRRPARLLTDVVRTQAAEIERLQRDVSAEEERGRMAASQAADQHRQLVESLARIDQCQTRIQQLEHEVQAMLSSRSWRWSGWLRGLRRRARI